MPAWHLAVESGTPDPFWHLESATGDPVTAEPRTTRGLLTSARGVRLLPQLAAELSTESGRTAARQAVYELLEGDGNDEAVRLLAAWPEDLRAVTDLERVMEGRSSSNFVLDDPDAAMVTSTRSAIVRDRALRRLVLPLYGHRCALCGTRLRWNGMIEVEAAHVKPRALQGVDDARNALALCRTHHWAFDQFLWTIEPGWKVRVQRQRPKQDDDLKALGAFKTLTVLAAGQQYLPHELALAWHRERFDRLTTD
jgi:putative restriction endonuclease